MEVVFGIHGVWDVIDLGSNEAKKNNITKALPFQSIPEEQILQIGNFKLAKEMWDAIKSRNMGAERVKDARLHTLIREFDGRFHANRVGVAGKVRTEDVVVDVAIRTVVHKEAPMKGINERLKKDYSEVQCFRCDEFGHFVSRCSERRKEKQANLADTEEKDSSLYMVQCVQEKVYLNEQKVMPKDYNGGSDEQDLWYLDNGASNNMTGNVSFFSELNKRVGGKVKFGDGSYVDICGKGSILLVGKTGEQQLLSDIYYIPSLQSNIISL
ncbi:uncharacterized protein LOC143624305 [Bidens hawaiensis]|uniref:uncharacterized protein LOC143624305 n=1 Tax=Bidens hawaiensis TaxID=980011 RepID=UPI00404AC6F6